MARSRHPRPFIVPRSPIERALPRAARCGPRGFGVNLRRRPGIWLDSNRLYFLRRIGQDYEFVSPYHPSLRAMPGLFSRHRRRSAA